MGCNPNAALGSIKRGVGVQVSVEWEHTVASAKVYSCSSRARDLLSISLFFFN
jgi:hypothetical protein